MVLYSTKSGYPMITTFKEPLLVPYSTIFDLQASQSRDLFTLWGWLSELCTLNKEDVQLT